jgi:hypothetical protein
MTSRDLVPMLAPKRLVNVIANCRFLVGGRGNLLLPVVAVENAGGLSAASVLPRPARRVDDRL